MKTNYWEPKDPIECSVCKFKRIHAVAMFYYCAHKIYETDEPDYKSRGISLFGICDDFEYLEDGEEQ